MALALVACGSGGGKQARETIIKMSIPITTEDSPGIEYKMGEIPRRPIQATISVKNETTASMVIDITTSAFFNGCDDATSEINLPGVELVAEEICRFDMTIDPALAECIKPGPGFIFTMVINNTPFSIAATGVATFTLRD